jgi:hypothetical protein
LKLLSYSILRFPWVVTKLSEYFSISVKFGITSKYFPSLTEYSSGDSRYAPMNVRFSSNFDLNTNGKVLYPESILG